MARTVRRRFWLETGLACLTAALLVLTLVSQEWIEESFGVDPDGGSGALEWGIVLALAVATVVLALVARRERRRPYLSSA
jgi:uncharacterized membrane protein YhaH (DUF805 family)